MGDEPGTEITTEFAKELAKQLPVKEALTASARQTGQLLEDIVKTIQLALAPLQFTGALPDRLRNFIDRSVRAVPEERRVSPPPQILGPVIEAIRYEPPDSELDQMFSELLSASMDETRLKDAHPAFPSMVRSLSSDEARLLKSILTSGPVRVVTRSKLNRDKNLFEPAIFEALQVPASLAYPGNCRIYLEHLKQLGLIDFSATRAPEPIMEEDKTAGVTNQVGVRNHGEHVLSEWGRQFMRAVTRPT
jgi:hypothetical protein